MRLEPEPERTKATEIQFGGGRRTTGDRDAKNNPPMIVGRAGRGRKLSGSSLRSGVKGKVRCESRRLHERGRWGVRVGGESLARSTGGCTMDPARRDSGGSSETVFEDHGRRQRQR